MLIFVAVGPMALCAIALLIACRPWRSEIPASAGWGGAIGFGAGLAPAMYAASAWSGLPPHTTWHWITVVVALAVVVGLGESVRGLPDAARWAGRLVLAGVAGWLIVGSWVPQPWLWRPIAVLSVLLTHLVIETSARRTSTASIAMSLGVAATAGSVLLVTLYELRMGLVVGGLGACLGAATLLALWRPQISLAGGATPVVATTFAGMMLSGYLQVADDLPGWTFVLLLVAPLGLLIDRVPAVSQRPALAFALRVVTVALPAAGAVAVAALAVAGEPDLPY